MGLKKEVTVKIGTDKNFRGNVVFDKGDDGVYRMAHNISIKKGGKEDTQRIINHEMRHIWQSENDKFYIKGDEMFWDGKPHIKVKDYNKIQKGIKNAKEKETFEKYKKLYNELPWEKDAIAYE